MTCKGSSEILILTKSMATARVFPRTSFIALTLQKAVLFHFSASSCSNFSVIAFQSQTYPALLQMISVSWLFRKNLRHISPRTHGSIACNRRSLRDIIKANKIATEFLQTKNKSWKIYYLYLKKTRGRYRSTDKKRCFIVVFSFTLRRFPFYCANKTVEIVRVSLYYYFFFFAWIE